MGDTSLCFELAQELAATERPEVYSYKTHDMTYSPEYRTWARMKYRCADLKNKDYGSRGITICPIWMHDFDAFLFCMGSRPHGLSLDRIDNNGPYCVTNCRWATQSEQATNRGHDEVWTCSCVALTTSAAGLRSDTPYPGVRFVPSRNYYQAYRSEEYVGFAATAQEAYALLHH